jgi:hypothetical protein
VEQISDLKAFLFKKSSEFSKKRMRRLSPPISEAGKSYGVLGKDERGRKAGSQNRQNLPLL